MNIGKHKYEYRLATDYRLLNINIKINFAGDHCEHQVNPCQNSPCVNNGQCTDISDHLNATMMVNTTNGETSLFGEQLNTTSDWNMTTNFRCTCEPGYSGDFCEIHGCGDHTCRNGAICIGGGWCLLIKNLLFQ